MPVKFNMNPKKNPMPSQDPNVRNKNFKEVTLGQIFEGLEVADAINQVAVDANDKPIEDVIVNSITIEEYKP